MRKKPINFLIKFSITLFVVVFFFSPLNPFSKTKEAFATSISSAQSGNWNDTATWTGGVVPGSGDAVTITNGHSVTVAATPTNGTISSLTIQGGGTATSVIFSGAYTLTVSNSVTIEATTNSSTINEIQVNTGTLNIGGGLNITSGNSATTISSILTTTGTLNITSGGVTFAGTASAARLNTSGAATVNITGTVSSGGALSINSATTVHSVGTATFSGAYTWGGALTVDASSTLTVNAGTTIISGTLTIQNTGTLTLGDAAFTASGSVSVSGTVNTATGSTGTRTFGALTINSGGVWDLSGQNPATRFIGSGITHNGTTFNNGTGLATFDTTATQSLAGSSAMTFGNNITIGSGITLTNNNSNTVTVGGVITLTGNWTQGANSYLNLTYSGPFSGAGTFNASTNVNTVEYSGSAQTAKAVTYKTLKLSGSGTKTLTSITTVGTDFTMSGSATATSSFTSIGGNVNISGTAIWTNGGANTVTGTLTVGTGAKLTMAGAALTITGTSSITGTVDTVTAATGTKTFVGAVTINSGGVWNLSTTNPATQFRGGITHNGTTFNNGTGTATFATTASQALAGSSAMTFGGAVTINTGITVTNNNSNTVTVAGTITLTGNWTQGTNSTLVMSGSTPFSGAGTFNASTNTNTVEYSGSAQTAKAVTYKTLKLSGSGTKTLTSITTVNGNFIMAGSATATAPFTTVGGNVDISGTAVMTSSATVTIFGTTTVHNGATLTFSSGGKNFFSTLTIGDGTSGTLNLSGNGGAGSYVFGDVVVNTGGIFDLSAGTHTTSFDGATIVMNGTTFNSGASSTSAFTNSSLTLSGSSNMTFGATTQTINNNVIVTNNNTGIVTFLGAVNGGGASSEFDTGPNSRTKFGGAVLTTGILKPSASENTVEYTGNTPTCKTPTTNDYYHLIFSGTSGAITCTVTTVTGNVTSSGGETWSTSLTTVGGNLTLSGTATMTQGAGLAITGNVVISGGTLTTGGNTLSASTLSLSTGTITPTSSTITLTGTGSVFNRTGGTYTAGTSTIKLTNTSSSLKTFVGNSGTYNNFWYAPGTGTGTIEILGSNTFADFKDDGTQAHSILFTAGTTTTVTSWTVSGNVGQLITINSGNGAGSTSTSTHTLSDTTGTNESDYLSIQHSIAQGGAGWYAGVNSTNNNSVITAGSGWIFTAGPRDMTISTNATTCTGSPNFNTNSGACVVNTTDIQTLLNAGTAVTFNATQDINVSNTFAKSSGANTSITMYANRNIIVSAAISSSSGTLDMLLNADRNADTSGYINIAAALTSNGGNITMGGGSGTISAGSGFAVGNSGQVSGVYVNNVTIAAGGGNVIVNGQGYNTTTDGNHGVRVTGASGAITTTGTGTIDIKGIASGNTNSGNNYGLYVDMGGVISSVNGNLVVVGTDGTSSGGTNYGVYIVGTGATIKTTGSGNLTVTGIRSNTNFGINIAVANGLQTTSSGDITVNTDTINLTESNDINSVGDLTIRPYTASTTVLVGSGSGTLALSDTYLGYITWGTSSTLTIGGTTAGDIAINTSSTILNKNVTFLTGGNIALATTALAHAGASAATLNMRAYGNITTTSAITASTSALTVNLYPDYDANASGAINIGAPVGSNGGTITILGGGGVIGTTTAWENLTINTNSNTVTLGSNSSITNGLTITSGTLQLSIYDFTVNGITSVSGTLTDNSATGTNIFVGAVTLNSGSVWSNSNNPAYEFRGGLTVNSTSSFTSGTGTYTFSINAQSVGGTQSYTITNLSNTITTGNGLTLSANPTITTLTQGASAVLTFSGTVSTITTLDASASGNVVVYAGSTQTIKNGTYHHLTLNGAGVKTLGGTTTVNGNLNVTAGTLDPSTYTITGSGTNAMNVTDIAIVAGATFADSYASFETITLNSGSTVTYSRAGDQTISNSPTYYNLTVSGSGTKSLAGATTIASGGNVTVSGGTFDPASYLMTGNGSNTLTVSSGATLDVDATTFALNYSAGFGTLNLNSGSTVTYSRAGDQTISNSPTYYNLTVSGSGTKSLAGATTIASGGTVTVSGGTFDPASYLMTGNGSNTLTVSSGATIDVDATTFALNYSAGFGTLNLNSGSTVTYSRAGDQTISNSPTYHHITFSGSGTKTLSGSIVANGAVVLSAGTVDTSGSSYEMSASSVTMSGGNLTPRNSVISITGAGNVWNYSSGTFTPGGSTIKFTDTSSGSKTFSGGGQTYYNFWYAPGSGAGTLVIAGSNTFNDFKDDGSSGHAIQFTAGTTTTISSSWNVNGRANNLISLNSTSALSTWTIYNPNPGYTFESDYLSIRDSVAQGVVYFYAGDNSVNDTTGGSVNSGWTFTKKPRAGGITIESVASPDGQQGGGGVGGGGGVENGGNGGQTGGGGGVGGGGDVG